MKKLFSLTLIGTGLSLLSQATLAATLCVDPNKGTCFATIQAAVDAAAPGDLININKSGDSKGYMENVVINTANLTLKGKGILGSTALHREKCPTTVIDGCETPAYHTGCHIAPAFTIGAANVTITRFKFRHASPAIRLNEGAVNASITHSCFVNNIGDVEGSVSDLLVKKSVMRSGAWYSIIVYGDRTRIEENRFFTADNGIALLGEDVVIVKNRMTSNDRCISVMGHRGRIEANHLKGCEDGIHYDGDQPMIIQNTIEHSPDENIEVDCFTTGAFDTCTGGSISGNIIIGNSDDDEGIYASGNNLQINNNQISFTSEIGIWTYGDFMTLSGNRIFRAGTASKTIEAGMWVWGDDNLIEKNTISLSDFMAIKNSGDNNVYRNNTFDQNGSSGIVIDSGDNLTIEDNKFRNNEGEGVSNRNGTNVDLINNFFTGNRTDICTTAGTFDTVVGNTFSTGGIATPCVVNP